MTTPVIDCLLAHRSIRKFTSQPIDLQTQEVLFKAGIRAATAGCLQQYSLIVIDDEEKKTQLKNVMYSEEFEFVSPPPLIIIAVVDTYRLKRWFALKNAPFYFDGLANLLIGFWDAIIALHNIVIAAESLGFGAYYIGNILSTNIRDVLDVPEHIFPAGMICLGYPDEEPEYRERLPLEAVVHRNGYQIPSDEEINEYFKVKDDRWRKLSVEEKERFDNFGDDITNYAQLVTVGHYTEKFINNENKRILENIKRADFKF